MCGPSVLLGSGDLLPGDAAPTHRFLAAVLYLPVLQDVSLDVPLDVSMSLSSVPLVPTCSSPVPLSWVTLPQARHGAILGTSRPSISPYSIQPRCAPNMGPIHPAAQPSPPSISPPHSPRQAPLTPVLCPRLRPSTPPLASWPSRGPDPEPVTAACPVLVLSPAWLAVAQLDSFVHHSNHGQRTTTESGESRPEGCSLGPVGRDEEEARGGVVKQRLYCLWKE